MAQKGLHMMPRTTNLLTANQSSVETDTTGFTATNSSINRVINEAWHGVASLEVITNNGAAGEGFGLPLTSLIPSVTYTYSIYLKGSGTVYLQLSEFTSGWAGLGDTNGSTITLTSQWQRASVTRTFGATGTNANLRVLTNVKQGITFYADGIQLIQSSFSLPWHLGGSTRAAQKLSVITPSTLPSDCGIGAIVKMDLASTQTGLPSMTFARQGPYHLYLDAADKKMKCTNGTVTVATPALTWAVNGVIDGYGGRIDGKLFVRAVVNGGAAQYAEAVADHVDSGTLLHVAERNIGLDFDGVDDLLTVTNYAGIQNIFDGGGTVEAWVKPRSAGVGHVTGSLFTKGTEMMRFSGSPILHFIHPFSTTGGRWSWIVPLNELCHLQLTYNNSSVGNVPVLKINNNVLTRTLVTTPEGTRTSNATTNLIIGKFGTTSWDGPIHGFRMWKGIRPDANDRFLRLIGNEANLAAAWPMDECTGATALNIVAGGNNAAITGGVWAAEQVVHGKVYDVRQDDRRKDVAAKLGVA